MYILLYMSVTKCLKQPTTFPLLSVQSTAMHYIEINWRYSSIMYKLTPLSLNRNDHTKLIKTVNSVVLHLFQDWTLHFQHNCIQSSM